jgi:hypothetical protein
VLAFLLQAVPEGGAVTIPQEITVSTPEILAKFALMALAAGAAGLLPVVLKRSDSTLIRQFRTGAIYALMPAVVIGAGLATAVTGISLTRVKFGSLDEFWPLPLSIFCFVLALESLGGILGVLTGAGSGSAP